MSCIAIDFVKLKVPGETGIIDKIIIVCSAVHLCLSAILNN